MSTQRVLFSAFAAALFSVSAQAQSVISAHSGTVHYFEGAVTIDGKPVENHVGKFSEIKENGTLKTALGRAEILLTPGVFLRVGENTEIHLVDNRLLSTRVELISGSLMLEANDSEGSLKDSAVTLIYKDYTVQPVKFGLFEISTESNQLKVYKGQAAVTAGSMRATIKDGRLMPFTAALVAEKFNEKDVDDLYLWTRDRSSHISAANMASARTLNNQGYSSGMLMGGLASGFPYNATFGGNWYYNSYLGMFTYIPYNGVVWSPFGFGYFSPYTILSYYSPSRYNWNGGGTARNGFSTGVPLTASGTSGVVASQIARYGSGMNTHPTLASPVRSIEANSAPVGGFRGMGDFGAPRAGFGGFNGAPNPGGNASSASVYAGSVAAAAPAPAPAPAAPASGGGPGGARGR